MPAVICRLHGHGAWALAAHVYFLEAHCHPFARRKCTLKVLLVEKNIGTGRWAADETEAACCIPARDRSLFSHVLPGC
jgi:hypothetical protein